MQAIQRTLAPIHSQIIQTIEQQLMEFHYRHMRSPQHLRLRVRSALSHVSCNYVGA